MDDPRFAIARKVMQGGRSTRIAEVCDDCLYDRHYCPNCDDAVSHGHVCEEG